MTDEDAMIAILGRMRSDGVRTTLGAIILLMADRLGRVPIKAVLRNLRENGNEISTSAVCCTMKVLGDELKLIDTETALEDHREKRYFLTQHGKEMFRGWKKEARNDGGV